MGMPTSAEVKKTAQILLECPPGAYRPLKLEIGRMAEASGVHLAFVGEHAPLNALVRLAMAAPEKYEGLIANLDRRRMVAGAEMRPAQKARKNEYMKFYMRQQRAKVRDERRRQTVTGRDLGEAVDELLDVRPKSGSEKRRLARANR